MKTRAALALIRPHNCVLAGVGVLIGGIISLEGAPSGSMIFAFLTAVLVTGAGNAINDYADRELDAVNNPDRPIPAGKISPSRALLTGQILFTIGMITAAFTRRLPCVLLAGLNSGLLVYYASILKRKGLIGNFTISYLVGSTFLFGGLAVGGFEIVGILALMAGFSTAGREIIKDIEDIKGDRESDSESFPIRFGRKKAVLLSVIFTGVAIALAPIPYWFGLFGKFYLGIVAVSIGTFIVGMIVIEKEQKEESASKASLVYKAAMGIGLLAFLVGALT